MPSLPSEIWRRCLLDVDKRVKRSVGKRVDGGIDVSVGERAGGNVVEGVDGGVRMSAARRQGQRPRIGKRVKGSVGKHFDACVAERVGVCVAERVDESVGESGGVGAPFARGAYILGWGQVGRVCVGG